MSEVIKPRPVSYQDVPDAKTVIGNEQLFLIQGGRYKKTNASNFATNSQGQKADTAVQSAAIGGSAVPKSGATLQFPAYPTTLPANGGNADTLGGNSPSDFLLSDRTITVNGETKNLRDNPSFTTVEWVTQEIRSYNDYPVSANPSALPGFFGNTCAGYGLGACRYIYTFFGSGLYITDAQHSNSIPLLGMDIQRLVIETRFTGVQGIQGYKAFFWIGDGDYAAVEYAGQHSDKCFLVAQSNTVVGIKLAAQVPILKV